MKIQIKLTILTFLTGLIILPIAANSFFGFQIQRQSRESIYKIHYKMFKDVVQIFTIPAQINGKCSILFSHIYTGTTAKKLNAQFEIIHSLIDSLEKRTKTVSDFVDNTNKMNSLLLDIEKLKTEHVAQVKSTIQILKTGDTDISAMKLLGTEKPYSNLKKQLKKLFAIALEQSEKSFNESGQNDILIMKILIVTGLLGIIIFLIASMFTTRSIIKPINMITKNMKNIKMGVLSKRLNIKTKDEIGILSRSLASMVENLQQKVLLAESIADGDLTRNIELASTRDDLGLSLNKMTVSLNETIEKIIGATTLVATSSESNTSSMHYSLFSGVQ